MVLSLFLGKKPNLMNHYFNNNCLYTDFTISDENIGIPYKSADCAKPSRPVPGLLEEYDREINYFESRVGKDRSLSTLKKHQSVRAHLSDFIFSVSGKKDISFADLTEDFIKGFCQYLTEERGLSNSTAWVYQIPLKRLVSSAFSKGLISSNPFAMFHYSPHVKERAYLTEGELKGMMEMPLEDKILKKVRDLFVFSCWTGLSYVDITALTKKSLVEYKGSLWITSQRKKTNKPFQIKVMDPAAAILVRYGRRKAQGTPIFRIGSYNYINYKLKEVVRLCGIKKNISFHCARHTFATMALNNGMSLESISQILGHSSIKTTQIYAKITMTRLDKDFSVFKDNIKDAFF